ncbi:MAG: hypothetical protein M3116_04155 [Actinomycetota bacterium]|nr:hypothetical protein [Actinomycetota bacterium]
MATPIVKLCLIRGYTEAYHQLSDAERKELWDKVDAGLQKVGGKLVGPYYDCRWSNDKYASFFLLEYPDVDAVIAESANVEEAGLFRYMVSETILSVRQAES